MELLFYLDESSQCSTAVRPDAPCALAGAVRAASASLLVMAWSLGDVAGCRNRKDKNRDETKEENKHKAP
jgi:hypothetical protein